MSLAASALLLALIHRSAWNKNSRKFISTIPDIHSYRAGAELYSSTSSMLWVGSCGQFALDWFGLHSILVPPPGTWISCPTYSIFPVKRKSSSRHRNVLSSNFRSGSLAMLPLPVGGLFLALSMHELRLSGRQLKFVDTSRPLSTERRGLGRRRIVSRYINELANGTT